MPERLGALDESFWGTVKSRCSNETAVLILERWARGAGRTSWFRLESEADVAEVAGVLRPGSEVIAYLDPDLPLEGPVDARLCASAHELLAQIDGPEEIVLLARRDDSAELDAEFINDWSELDAVLRDMRGRRVWLGRYPPRPQQGSDAEIATVPDADGVARPHPH